MTAALLTLPVSLLDARLLALPAILGLGQVAAIGFNERVLKGKDWRDWIRVMPLCIAYYGFKATGAYATRLRLIAGGETEIRKSKRALEAARRGESG